MRVTYRHTLYACYGGYITQAIVNNFVPLLFLTFSRQFGLSLSRIALITTINFAVQLLTDLVSAWLVDRLGYRRSVVTAHLLVSAGLAGLAVFPGLMGDAFAGILLAVILYAVGGGLIEVVISPIVEACPTENKEKAMSLLHSFYCWGHLGVILLSTLFFRLAGIENWQRLALVWAVFPLANGIFFGKVPILSVTEEQEPLPFRRLLKQKAFWLFIVLMICAGASEQGMSQWASAFAESALHVSKTTGDLAGPCLFAFFMGISRTLYGKKGDKIPLEKAMPVCALLCIGTYLAAAFSHHAAMGLAGCALCGFSVGIFWPGTFSLAAVSIPSGGTAMYALMALAGDIGCMSGPTLVGFVAGIYGDNLKAGLLAALAFPVCILFCVGILKKGRGGRFF